MARKALLVQGHASGRLLQHREERACRRAGSTHRASCKAIVRSPHSFPSAPPGGIRTSSGSPSRGSVESPFPEHQTSTVYITVGVASSEQSRSPFGAQKSQGRRGSNDRSCWGGGKSRRRIPRHSRLLSQELQLPMTPRVPALPRVQQKDDPQLSSWDRGVCDSHSRLGVLPTHSSFSW